MESIRVFLKGGTFIATFCVNDFVESLPDGTRFHYFELNGYIVMSINEEYIEKIEHVKF